MTLGELLNRLEDVYTRYGNVPVKIRVYECGMYHLEKVTNTTIDCDQNGGDVLVVEGE